MLPTNFGPWQTVYWWFRRFVRRMLFQTIHDVSLMLDRERVGREASPSGGMLDSQTVKAPQAKARGYDANKKIVGRKRHIAVDTDGRLLMVNLTTADISDSARGTGHSLRRAQALAMAQAPVRRWRLRPHQAARQGATFRDFALDIVRRTDAEPGFTLLPRRWAEQPDGSTRSVWNGCGGGGAHLWLDDALATARA